MREDYKKKINYADDSDWAAGKLQETRDRESLELERIRQCAIRDIAVAHIKILTQKG